MANFVGDDLRNIISGGAEDDLIQGLGGDDQLRGGEAADNVSGDNGDDLLLGDGGDDLLYGGAGGDTLRGLNGDDLLAGGAGDDVLEGRAGLDTVSFESLTTANPGLRFAPFWSVQFSFFRGDPAEYGVVVDLSNTATQLTGQGWDRLTGIENARGTAFADQIRGSSAANVIEGGGGQDDLFGSGGADYIYGGDANDFLEGASDFLTGGGDLAVDHLYGGAGEDFIVAGRGDIVDGGDGFDKVIFSFADRTTGLSLMGDEWAAFSDVAYAAGVQAVNVEDWSAAGSQYNDLIYGDASFNELWGLAGNDHLIGHVGEDYLYGGDGDDHLESKGVTGRMWDNWDDFGTLYGGDGSDRLEGSAASDVIDTGGDDGDIDYAYGGDGNDSISAGPGDVANGGGGSDHLSISLSGLTSGVTIDYGTAGDLNALYSSLLSATFTGFESFSVWGTEHDDVIAASAAGLAFSAGGGNDTLTGKAGADSLFGGAGDDTVRGGDQGDTLGGDAGSDFVYGEGGNDNLYTYVGDGLGTDVDVYDGGAGVDTLTVQAWAGVDLTLSLTITTAQAVGAGLLTLIGFESLNGGEGDDALGGSGVANTLGGGGGDDVLRGFNGADILRGGAGDDLLVGGTQADTLDGDDGFDLIDYTAANASQAAVVDLRTGTTNDGFGTADTLTSIEGIVGGTRFADVFHGTDGVNLLVGSISDSLYGHGGNDAFRIDSALAVLDGGAGDDVITAFLSTRMIDANNNGVGDFQSTTQGVELDLATGQILNDGWGGTGSLISVEGVYGSAYDDVLRGSAGNNLLGGAGGDDLLNGGAGVDRLEGGDGYDRLSFHDLSATQGVVVDLRTGVIANDGFGNAETMTGIEAFAGGTRFADSFHGDQGGNGSTVGGGDTAYGYGGEDLFVVEDAPLLIDGGNGVDTVTGFTRSRLVDADNNGVAEVETTLDGVVVNLTSRLIVDDGFGGMGAIRNIENLAGSGGNDILTGSSVDNVLWGGQGDDLVAGAAGSDTIDGGQGYDSLKGDAGDDSLLGGEGDDILNGGTGHDVIDGGDGFDRVSYYGAAAVSVDLDIAGAQDTGGGGIDTLIAVEALEGGNYADTLKGSAGQDVFWGGNGIDTVVGRAGDDLAYGQGGDDMLGGDAGADTLYGGAGFDLINGGDDADHLYGEVGNDTLNGDTGDDSLYGGDGADTANGGFGSDLLRGEAGNDLLHGDGDDDTLEGGVGNDTLNGGEGADDLSGGDGTDTLNGGDGEDILFGGLARDILTGGAGNDLFLYTIITDSTATVRDTIVDFSAGDILNLSAIDADVNAADDQAFTLVSQLTGVAGQLMLKVSGGSTMLMADVTGDGVADFMIQILGAHATTDGFML